MTPGASINPPRSDAEPQPPDLGHWALFVRFLRFGILAFGGPVAQIAMIRRELVDEERWIGSGSFNKLLAVMQVLPGPEAHELCVHLGIRAKGRIGGILAGLGFMLPGFVLMLALAWLYTRLKVEGSILGAMFLGVQAAVLAIILRALHRIGEHILLDGWLWTVAIGAAVASASGASFWLVLPTAGAVYALASAGRRWVAAILFGLALASAILLPMTIFDGSGPTAAEAGSDATVAALFWTGLKGGLLTFGGAYTAIPFVRNDTVDRGWMSDAQFLDGLALAGILPAPLVIFATFVGWISGGLAGALAITLGMFLPAFAFSLIFYERLEALAGHERLHAFLTGVAAAVMGIIAVTFVDLASALADRTPDLGLSLAVFLAALSLVILWKSKAATPLVLAAAAAFGAVAFR